MSPKRSAPSIRVTQRVTNSGWWAAVPLRSSNLESSERSWCRQARPFLGWLIAAALPFAAHGTSTAQQEFDSVLHCKVDLARGQKLFDTCAACHSSDGSGASDGTVPAIAAQHFSVIASELIEYRHDGRWDERMEHFTDNHHMSGAQDIADIAAYVSRLRPTPALGQGSGEYVKHGAEVYARLCASCHGARGEGDNLKRYPRLAGQHYEYLLAQLHDAAGGRRPNFPPAHIHLLQSFGRADYIGIADYLSRLGP